MSTASALSAANNQQVGRAFVLSRRYKEARSGGASSCTGQGRAREQHSHILQNGPWPPQGRNSSANDPRQTKKVGGDPMGLFG